jgi:hypoxanthine-DNA glycosylase
MTTKNIPRSSAARVNVGFPPVCTGADLVLVLGSFPGRASLQKNQYYAHPYNGFWPIMGELLGFDHTREYGERVGFLNRNRVALWDVLTSCSREGSLDSSIRKDSMIINEFDDFFENNRSIHTIFFNGAVAEAEFRKRVLTTKPLDKRKFVLHRLPSTSPALATLSLSQKIQAWSVLLVALGHTKEV